MNALALCRLTRVFLIAVLMVLALPAWATPLVAESKMDMELREKFQLAEPIDAQEVISFFVKTHEVMETLHLVESLGGTVGTVSGDILTVRMPAHGFYAMRESDSIVRMEAMRPVETTLDRALAGAGVTSIHSGAEPLEGSFTGAGVILGVIDRGFDLDHSAFKRKDGSNRVLSIWDQSAMSGNPPGGRWTYGNVCTMQEINAGCRIENIDSAHGTHVAGIAGGSPVGNLPYTGAAPDADLIFVQLPAVGADWETTSEPASDGHICDGAAWVFSQAYEQNKPAVINMSVGSHWGPHDSTSLASQCLTNLTLRGDGSTVPGKILVAAAGNEGAGGGLGWIDYGQGWERTPAYTHASALVGASPVYAPFRVGFDHYVGTERDPIEIFQDLVSFWFNGEHNLKVRVGVVHSENDITWTPEYAYDDLLTQGQVQLLTSSQGVYGHVSVMGDVNAEGARCIRAYVSDWDSDGSEGDVAFVVELMNPSGEAVKVDGFMEVSNEVRPGGFLNLGIPAGTHFTADNQMSIGFPGNNPNVVAVGSYVTRRTLGEGAESPDSEGDRAGSSSRGPTRDESMTGFKPDVMAPGQFIVAPLSADYQPDLMEQYLEEVLVFEGSYGARDSYIAYEGTSMASPIVAGTIALMLEYDPELSLERIREILQTTSTSDRFTGDLPNYDFGYGKLNAHLAMQELTGTSPTEAGCSATPVGVWFLLPLVWFVRRRLI